MAKINLLSIHADTADMTLVMAAVGAADLAVEKARGITKKSGEIRVQVSDLPAEAQGLVERLLSEVQGLPKTVAGETKEVRARASKRYNALAARGEDLVERIQNDPNVDTLRNQSDTAVAKSKGVVTSARKAVKQTESAAKATLTTGRKEAAKVGHQLVDAIEKDGSALSKSVKQGAARTRSSAKRTAATAKKATANTRKQAAAARTSTRKAGSAAKKATESTAKKVGD